MTNYRGAGIELTLIDGRKIDVYPAGLITGQDEIYLPMFDPDERYTVQSTLATYANELFKPRLLGSLHISCRPDFSIAIDNYADSFAIPYFNPLPESNFQHTVDVSDLAIPVTRMSKPSSNGEISASRTGASAKIITGSFLVREQRTDIREAIKTFAESVAEGEKTFINGMNTFDAQLPKIKAELIEAGRKHLKILSDFYMVSQKRPLREQVLELSSQRDSRWRTFRLSQSL